MPVGSGFLDSSATAFQNNLAALTLHLEFERNFWVFNLMQEQTGEQTGTALNLSSGGHITNIPCYPLISVEWLTITLSLQYRPPSQHSLFWLVKLTPSWRFIHQILPAYCWTAPADQSPGGEFDWIRRRKLTCCIVHVYWPRRGPALAGQLTLCSTVLSGPLGTDRHYDYVGIIPSVYGKRCTLRISEGFAILSSQSALSNGVKNTIKQMVGNLQWNLL